MRVRFALLVMGAVFIVGSRRAAANDAGGTESAGADAPDAAIGAGAIGDSSASQPPDLEDLIDAGDGGEQTPVIACDGALCDTTQGRPTCTVISGSVGRRVADPRQVAACLMVLALAFVRKAKRGA